MPDPVDTSYRALFRTPEQQWRDPAAIEPRLEIDPQHQTFNTALWALTSMLPGAAGSGPGRVARGQQRPDMSPDAAKASYEAALARLANRQDQPKRPPPPGAARLREQYRQAAPERREGLPQMGVGGDAGELTTEQNSQVYPAWGGDSAQTPPVVPLAEHHRVDVHPAPYESLADRVHAARERQSYFDAQVSHIAGHLTQLPPTERLRQATLMAIQPELYNPQGRPHDTPSVRYHPDPAGQIVRGRSLPDEGLGLMAPFSPTRQISPTRQPGDFAWYLNQFGVEPGRLQFDSLQDPSPALRRPPSPARVLGDMQDVRQMLERLRGETPSEQRQSMRRRWNFPASEYNPVIDAIEARGPIDQEAQLLEARLAARHDRQRRYQADRESRGREIRGEAEQPFQ